MRKKTFYSLFFVILLITEFYYIPIGGGTARIYHFVAPLIILSLFGYIHLLFRTRVFIALLGFFIVNLIAAFMADAPNSALISLLGLGANISVAIAVALILISDKVDLLSLKRLIFSLTLLSIVLALIQIAVFHLGGVSFALSFEQESQILQGFGPAFRTEANTFGKYLIVPFLLFLPEFVKSRRKKHMTYLYVTLIIGILAVFTRSAIYGLGLAMIFILFWYLVHGQISIFARTSSKIVIFASAGLVVLVSGYLNVSEYALHKIDTFFSQEEILEGGSSLFRIMSMQNTLDAFLTNEKTVLIGKGWGQVHMSYGGNSVQTGGGDLLTTLGYGGLLGGGAYLLFMFLAFFSVMKVAKTSPDRDKGLLAEGVMFALFGVFLAGQMSGYMIAPEYWLLIGVSIFLSAKSRRRSAYISARYR